MEGDGELETGISARLTPREGRKFGLVVGGAFLLFGAISHWRGHSTAPLVMWTVGGVLVAAGLVIPGHLGPVYRGWMGVGHTLSRVTTPIFMGLVYYLVFTPVGVLMRLFGRYPLAHKVTDGSYWVRRTDTDSTVSTMSRQF